MALLCTDMDLPMIRGIATINAVQQQQHQRQQQQGRSDQADVESPCLLA
jgi:hypothetical protein